jgi:hypothetical protein
MHLQSVNRKTISVVVMNFHGDKCFLEAKFEEHKLFFCLLCTILSHEDFGKIHIA